MSLSPPTEKVSKIITAKTQGSNTVSSSACIYGLVQVREEAAATTLEEGLGKHKPGRLPDPDEERTQETLIAARQALWQQNFMRIQRWLQSESITMEGETNRAYARAAGDLEDGQ